MKLKQIPTDFLVREISDIKTKGTGSHAVFLMRKTNFTTLKAIRRISEALRKRESDFSVSGMKDKDAITEQYVAASNVKKEQIERLTLKDIKLKFVGYSDERIRLASHKANSFEIIARDLEKPLTPLRYMCNYYDNQRFGGIRPNMAAVGKLILERKYERAMIEYLCKPFPTETEDHRAFRKKIEENWGKFNPALVPRYLTEKVVIEHLAKYPDDFIGAFATLPRQISTLFIHSYQSKLFNEILAKYIEKNFENLKYIDYCHGKLPVTTEKLDINIPLIGYDFDNKGELKDIVKEILDREDFRLALFRIDKLPYLSSRTVMRPGFVELKNFRIETTNEDELNKGKLKQKVSFTLPTGSFATIALKTMEKVS